MHAMAYDCVNKQVLMFGGSRNRGESAGSVLGDTWLWDGQDWIQVADSGPSPRRNFAMSTDPQRQRIILFGGETADGSLAGDTWEWNGTEWVHREDVGPSARAFPRMAYDAGSELLLLFGGDDGSTPSDTWGWNGEHWAQLADTGPLGRIRHAMSPDGVGVVLFGGAVSAVAARDASVDVSVAETWAYYEDRWRQVHDIGPASRDAHAMAYDDQAQRLILFGGQDIVGKTIRGDTWFLIDRPKRAK